MLFTSFGFFVFLPLALVGFAAVPARHRWLWLLLASAVFYGLWQPANLLYLGAMTLAVLGCGRGLDRARGRRLADLILAGGLVLVLGSLFAFKFYDFLAAELEGWAGPLLGLEPAGLLPRIGVTAPAGYSFYAFAAASYLVDARAGRLPAERTWGHTALYVAYFPKIFAGPIERATTFLPQVWSGLRANPEMAVLGLQLIGWGLFKKVVIADNLAPVVDRSFTIAAYAPPMELLLSVYFFAFQIYCDFSGYTDIAVGVSLLFGIRLMENFRRPYLSVSTAEFWGSRWHISLGHWFRDYLFIPLGGSKAGPMRRYLNIMAVFTVSGLWHAGLGYGVGWTFLVWGALNGLYQWVGVGTAPVWRGLGERMPRVRASTALRVLRAVLTFHLIAIAWVFFRASSVGDALLVLKRIGTSLGQIAGLVTRYPYSVDHYLAFGLIALLLVIEVLDERRSIFQRLSAAPVALRWGVYYLVLFSLLILGRWQAKEFIYMQF
ncbi:MAG: MBOAT family O-acyltransferase [Deferrisomatales bacterium]|nr:MBOAT family O-acyltransferase [Deferrisomatales bacterium]